MGLFDSLFGGSEEEVTTSSTVGPPEWAVPYLQSQMAQNQSVWNTPREYYGGQTYADMSGQRQEGLNMAEQLASNGAPLTDSASSYVDSVLAGDYLTPDALISGAQGAINKYLPGVKSGVNAAGGMNRSLGNAAMGDVISNQISNQYGLERGRMGQAAAMAPGLDSAAYMPAQQMMNIGRQYEAQDQLGINEDINRYNFNRDDPYNRALSASQSVQGLLPLAGQTQENTQTVYGPSLFDQIVGVGTTAAGLFSGNPLAAAGGGASLFGGGSGFGNASSWAPMNFGSGIY